MIYLGTINNAGSDVKNNTNATVPFVIPKGACRLAVQPSAANMAVAISVTNPAFAPAITAMFSLGAANSYQDFPVANLGGLTLASRKTDAGAGTLKVFLVG